MRVSYHHANPGGGNESLLLRFDWDGEGESVVMVDAGANVETPHIVGRDAVDALCLTHAHSDHYQSIERCLGPETRVFAAPDTRKLLDDVFDVAETEFGGNVAVSEAERFEAIDGWTEVAPGVEAHPVPAGHAPGAVGYCFRFEDGGQRHHLLATGDFTSRRAAGYPGFTAEDLPDVDVLFLTVATDETFSQSVSEGLARALQRAHGGAKTLVTTSGLFGVHAAYLLSRLAREFDRQVPIRVVGQVAKLYNALEYDCPNVVTTEFFEDPSVCLDPGGITIAGPDVPTERSSGRLFGLLRDDPGAAVVQLVGSGSQPVRDAGCTVHDYEVVNHPRRSELDAVHDELSPVHTVVVHRHRGAGSEYNDWGSCVWSPDDSNRYTLYEDEEWTPPPWMPYLHQPRTNGSGRSVGELVGAELLDAAAPSLPAIQRRDDVDLEAEGIDLELVASVLDQRGVYGAMETTADQATEDAHEADPAGEAATATRPEAEPAARTESTMNGTENGATGSVEDDQPTERRALTRTTGPDLEPLDPGLQRAIAEGELTREELLELYAAANAEAEQTSNENAASTDEAAAAEQPDDTTVDGEASAEELAEESDEASEEDPDEASVTELETETETESGEESEAPELDETSEADTEAPPATESETNPPARESDVTATEAAEVEGPERSTPSESGENGESDESSGATGVELDALTVAVGSRLASQDRAFDAVVSDAVASYLERVLAGEDVGGSVPSALRLDGPPGLLDVLDDAVAADERYGDRSALLTEGLAAALSTAEHGPVTVTSLGPYLPLLDAVAANEKHAPTDREEVVQAAVWLYVAAD